MKRVTLKVCPASMRRIMNRGRNGGEESEEEKRKHEVDEEVSGGKGKIRYKHYL